MAKSQIVFENLSKAQERCFNLIKSLGIYELRAIARVFGDNSPTTSKRDDHILFIMNKILSGEDLQPIPLRQGRPYKELSNIEGILEELSAIIGKDYTLKTLSNKQNDTIKTIGFRQVELDVVKKKLFPIKVKGIVLNRTANEFYIINEDNSLPILIEKRAFPQLEQFDFVEGTAVVMNDNNEYIMDNIASINFIDIASYSPNLVSQERALPSKKLKVNDKEITLGLRYLLNEGKLTENFEQTRNIVASLQQNNVKCLALVTNAIFDDYISLSNIGFDNIYLLKFDDKPSVYYKKINVFLNSIKRLQEIGTNIAIFVQDIVTLSHVLDAYNKNSEKSYFNHTEETANIIKEIIMLAKTTLENSTTIFVTNEETDNLDLLYMTFVSKVSTKL